MGWPLALRCLAALGRCGLLPREMLGVDPLRYGSAEWGRQQRRLDDSDNAESDTDIGEISVMHGARGADLSVAGETSTAGMLRGLSWTVLALTGLGGGGGAEDAPPASPSSVQASGMRAISV